MGRASRVKAERRAVSERSGEGDCFEVAVRLLMSMPAQVRDTARLCHGIVTGNAEPITGVRYAHAWVEIGDTVFDFSNGNQYVSQRERYYSHASIDPREVVRYTFEDATVTMLRTRHYGPWQGVDSLAS